MRTQSHTTPLRHALSDSTHHLLSYLALLLSLPFISFLFPFTSDLSHLSHHSPCSTYTSSHGGLPPPPPSPSTSLIIYSSPHLLLTSSTLYPLHHSFHLSPVVLTSSSQWHYYYHYYHLCCQLSVRTSSVDRVVHSFSSTFLFISFFSLTPPLPSFLSYLFFFFHSIPFLTTTHIHLSGSAMHDLCLPSRTVASITVDGDGGGGKTPVG